MVLSSLSISKVGFLRNDGKQMISILTGAFLMVSEATFKVSCSTPQRFVRLTQVEENWCERNILYINQIEFSGLIFERFS